MKTYTFDALTNITEISLNFKIQSLYHENKVWYIFNDSSLERELYIFQNNGTLLIVKNGKINNGTWKYIPTNKYIILNIHEKSYIAHVVFTDNSIIALQVEDTKQYAFFIDEQNKQNFHPKHLSDIKNYLALKKQRFIEEKSESKKRLLERQHQDNIKKEESELRSQANLIKQKNKIIQDCNGIKGWFCIFAILYIGLILIVFVVTGSRLNYEDLSSAFITSIVLSTIRSIADTLIEKKNIKKWINENPNASVNKYL